MMYDCILLYQWVYTTPAPTKAKYNCSHITQSMHDEIMNPQWLHLPITRFDGFLEEFNDFVHMFQVPRRFRGYLMGLYIKKDCLI